MGHVSNLNSNVEPSFNLLPGLEVSPFKITPVEVVLFILSLMRANEIDTLRRTCRSFKQLADRPEVQRLVAIKLNLTHSVHHAPEILQSMINLKSKMNRLLCRLSDYYTIEGKSKKRAFVYMQALREEELVVSRNVRVFESTYRVFDLRSHTFLFQVIRRLLEDILKNMPPKSYVSLSNDGIPLTIVVKDEQSQLSRYSRENFNEFRAREIPTRFEKIEVLQVFRSQAALQQPENCYHLSIWAMNESMRVVHIAPNEKVSDLRQLIEGWTGFRSFEQWAIYDYSQYKGPGDYGKVKRLEDDKQISECALPKICDGKNLRLWISPQHPDYGRD
jgi:hypothetical protein